MLEEKYEVLLQCLEGMIADGVVLVHGGQVFDWRNTKIPELLRSIREEKHHVGNLRLEPGDLLENVHSGQHAAVIDADHGIVKLAFLDSVLIFPKEKLWLIFKPVEVNQD